MDIELLEASECLVECWVRGITVKANDIEASFPLLKKVLKYESEGLSETPKIPHTAARKNPRKELKACLTKLDQIRNDLIETFSAEVADKHCLDISRARLYHISSRLLRVSVSSPTYGQSARTLKNECDLFVETIEDYLTETISKEITLDTMRSISLTNLDTEPPAPMENPPGDLTSVRESSNTTGVHDYGSQPQTSNLATSFATITSNATHSNVDAQNFLTNRQYDMSTNTTSNVNVNSTTGIGLASSSLPTLPPHYSQDLRSNESQPYNSFAPVANPILLQNLIQ